MSFSSYLRVKRKQFLDAYPHLALVREGLSVKAKNEPNFRFYSLYGLVVEKETLMFAWHMVKSNGGAPGVDGATWAVSGEQVAGTRAKWRTDAGGTTKTLYIAQPTGLMVIFR